MRTHLSPRRSTAATLKLSSARVANVARSSSMLMTTHGPRGRGSTPGASSRALSASTAGWSTSSIEGGSIIPRVAHRRSARARHEGILHIEVGDHIQRPDKTRRSRNWHGRIRRPAPPQPRAPPTPSYPLRRQTLSGSSRPLPSNSPPSQSRLRVAHRADTASALSA